MGAEQVERALRALAEPERAALLQRYFKTGPGQYGEGDRFLGLRVPQVRRVASHHTGLAFEEVEHLLGSPWHEARLAALLIWVRQFPLAAVTGQRRIYTSYLAHTDRINNWDLVDLSAGTIVGGWLAARSRRPLYRLARSSALWERRIAIMATFPYIRQGELDDTYALAAALLGDPADLIHKAVGWMLREAGKVDRPRLQDFLRGHYDELPRTTLRYAIERFPSSLRQRYLAGRF